MAVHRDTPRDIGSMQNKSAFILDTVTKEY